MLAATRSRLKLVAGALIAIGAWFTAARHLKLVAGGEQTASYIPDNGMCCVEGPAAYIADALRRLRDGPLGPSYLLPDSYLLKPLKCEQRGYHKGPYAESCYPKGTLWMDENFEHAMLLKYDEGWVQTEFARTKNISIAQAWATYGKGMCD